MLKDTPGLVRLVVTLYITYTVKQPRSAKPELGITVPSGEQIRAVGNRDKCKISISTTISICDCHYGFSYKAILNRVINHSQQPINEY